MYHASSELTYALQQGRIALRLTDSAGETLAGEGDIRAASYTTSCCTDNIGMGGAYAASLTVTVSGQLELLDQQIVALIGTGTDFLPLGVFVVSECRTGEDTTDLTAYDAIYYAMAGTYTPGVESGATAAVVLADLAAQCGVEAEEETLALASTVSITGALSGHSCREMLGYLAALCGGNAVISREGKIRFVWFAETDIHLTADDYYAGEYTWGGESLCTGMTCTVPVTGTNEEGQQEETTEDLTVGDMTNGITVECPYMTQERLEAIWTQLDGYRYPILDLGICGGLQLEPGDIVLVTNRDGVSAHMPIMSVELSLDGGSRCRLSSFGHSRTDATSRPLGPTTAAIAAVLQNIWEGVYDGEDATVLRIDSSHGVLFKNSIFSTVLTVTIQRGSKTVTDADTLRAEYGAGAYLQWKWRKFDDEAFRTISSADSRLRRDGFELVVTPEDVDEKIVFQCDLEV